MSQGVKDYISYLLYRTIGIAFFTRRVEWRKIMDWLCPEKGEKILDVACGCGDLSLRIARRGCKVYGIDMSEDAVKFARSLSRRVKTACEFDIGDAEHLPYPDGYFDKVVCSSALEHFNDDTKALKEMRRVLKLNGKIVLTVDSFTYPIRKELKDRHRKMCFVVNYYTHTKLEESFNMTGLKMCRSQYLLNSWLTSFFMKLAIKSMQYMIPWLFISFISYPALLISDKIFGLADGGYTLIAEARTAD